MNSLLQATTISLDDTMLFATTVGCYAVYRFVMCRSLLPKLASILKVKNQYKFVHRTFDFLHYFTSAVLGLVAISTRPYGHCMYYANDCQELLLQNDFAFDVNRLEKMYIMLFIAYYINDVPYLTTQADFITTAAHHVFTIFLIVSSISLHVPALCVVIMTLHDVVDVPLYLGKVTGYLGYTKVKEVSLLSFAALCFWFRMYNYLVVSIYAIKNIGQIAFRHNLYVITTFFLGFLYLCHCVWTYDIIWGLARVFKGNRQEIRDNRSD